jgi:hypothetical protein
MIEAMTALAQEPWCFHPDQIARLTDWQIMNVYLRPAVKRSEQMRKEMKQAERGHMAANSITSLDDMSEPTTDLPPKDRVMDIAAMLGVDRAKASQGYDLAAQHGGG